MRKKATAILIAAWFTWFQLLYCMLPCFASTEHLPGDVDGDGQVTLEDARKIALVGPRIIASLADPKIADVDRDGAITDRDALSLAEKITGERQLVATFVEHGKGREFIIGSMVTICVFTDQKESSRTQGFVRITSKRGDYDSGPQKLTLSGDGRYLFYHWSTTGLEFAEDYEVRVTFHRSAEDARAKAVTGPPQLTIRLIPRLAEKKVFAASQDLSLPSRTGKMQFERTFTYESSFYPYCGPLGYVWNHNFNLHLIEYPDGLMALFQADRPVGYFRSDPGGSYQSSPGDHRTLKRLDDGSFQLVNKDQTTWHFGHHLLLDSIEDPNGNALTLSYDDNGLLRSVSDGSEQEFVFEYDVSGRLVLAADHLDRKVTFKYDKVGNLMQSTDVGGWVTKYEYDAEHRLTRIIYPDGSSQYYRYDEDGRLASEERDQGFGAEYYEYDLETGETTITDATAKGFRLRVNEQGQPIQVSDCLDCPGRTWTMAYDKDFNLSHLADSRGHTYEFGYDDRGNPTTAIDPLGNRVSYSYEADFNKVTDLVNVRGNRTVFSYDSKGNLAETTYPDGSRETFQYDLSGNLVGRTDRAGHTTSYSYDHRGLLVKKTYPNGTKAEYLYDKYGHVVKATNSTSQLDFVYDKTGRVSAATYPGDRTFTYQYDAAGKRTRMTDPDGRPLSYEYDTAGRLTGITDDTGQKLVQYQYDAAGRLTMKRLGEVAYSRYRYGSLGQVLQIDNYDRGDSLISFFHYTYEASGNLASVTTLEGTEIYTHDALNRLTSVIYADGSRAEFIYDPMGNRLITVENGLETAYSVNDLDQYEAAGLAIYEYDACGNFVSETKAGDTIFYEYDFENRLLRVLTASDSIRYTYDPFGLRNGRIHQGHWIRYLRDVYHVAIEENDAHETVTRSVFGPAIDEIICVQRDNDSFWYLRDRLGSVTRILRSDGGTVDSYQYDVFGSPRRANLIDNPYMFAGREYDPRTGLYYYRARYYHPYIGRFLTADPHRLQGRANVYAYAFNNPTRYIDPLGLQAELTEDWLTPLDPFGGPHGWMWDASDPSVPGPDLDIDVSGGPTSTGAPGPSSPGSPDPQGNRGNFPCGNSTGCAGPASSGVSGSTSGGVCPTFVQGMRSDASLPFLPLESDSVHARVLIPSHNSLLRSDIPIFGLAGGKNFTKYRVEYGGGENPTTWHSLEESTVPKDSVPDFQDISWMQGDLDIRGNLATWNTGLKNWEHLPWHPAEDTIDLNGVYTLRLVVSGKNGETVEDRVTVEVGRVIAQCLPGIAVSTDRKVTMRFQEQSLMAPYRVYTIRPVTHDAPSLPDNQVLVSPVYKIREGGDWFLKPVALEMEYPDQSTADYSLSSLGVFAYNPEEQTWQLLKTELDQTQNLVRTRIYSLPAPEAYFAIMASKNGVEQSSRLEPGLLALNQKPEPTQVGADDSVLVINTFEADLGEWSERDREAGARVSRDDSCTDDGSYCLKLENKNFGGNFACDVRTTGFDAGQFPMVSFDYRITPDVKIDFFASVDGRWYDIGFTDDRNEYRNEDVNIQYLGRIPGIVADGKWRSASFDLGEMLSTATRKTQVDCLIMADWDVGGYMKLEFGSNSRGAAFYLDNFAISRQSAPTNPLPLPGEKLWVEDFAEKDSVNCLGGKRGVFTSPGVVTCTTGILGKQSASQADDSVGHALVIDFDVSAAGNYGGYWTSLEHVSLDPSSELILVLADAASIPPFLVGLKKCDGREAKVPIGPYLPSDRSGNGFVEARVPLSVFGALGTLSEMENVSISFENRLGSGTGRLLIDNVRLANEGGWTSKSLIIDDFEEKAGKYNFLGGEKWTFASGEATISCEVVLDSVDGHASNCLRITYGGSIGKDLGLEGFSYCAWVTSLQGLRVNESDFLEFDIRGAIGGGMPNVYLDDGNMRRPYLFQKGEGSAGRWRHVSIPVSAFAELGIDLTHLDEVQFVFEWQQVHGTIYLDNLQVRSGPSGNLEHAAFLGGQR